MLLRARRQVIIAIWGVVQSRGAAELKTLAELLDIPVATSPKAKGVFPENHPLSLGVLGFAGNPVAKEYVVEKDVDILLAVGTSFNEKMTGGWDKRLQPAECLIQIDVDAREMEKNYCASIELVGDARTVLREIGYAANRQLGTDVDESMLRDVSPYQKLEEIKARHRAMERRPVHFNCYYHPQELVEDLQKSLPANTIYFAEMGNRMAWAIRHLRLDNPYSFYLSLGFSSMGYATTAPLGAKLAFPDRPIVSLVGDGAFLMNGFEVATAVNYNIPVIWVVLNNAMLGMVHHGRRLFKKPIPEDIPSEFRRSTLPRSLRAWEHAASRWTGQAALPTISLPISWCRVSRRFLMSTSITWLFRPFTAASPRSTCISISCSTTTKSLLFS